jgi:transglutaminase-like putative cysteine protease
MTAMKRTVTSHLDLTLSGPAKLVFSVAVAQGAPFATEELTLVADGKQVQAQELVDANGTRLHVLQTDAGQVTLDYRAVVQGQFPPPAVDELDLVTYLRPSRYCESDSLGPTAASEFAGLQEEQLLAAVSNWVADKLTYVAGSSLPTDGAVRTLLGRQGVCRDFAHLSVALLRALNVPARLAAVFAPGLSPMEYHAVCEAYVNGAWYIIDGTHLAPRQSLLRVSTGRDAADTAFLTNLGGGVQLTGLEVTAVVDDFPWDDGSQLLQLV